MSAFYGTVEGQRGPATRCGSRGSDIKTAAQSWNGSVIINLHYEEWDDDESPLMVEVRTDNGSSAYGHLIWDGSFESFVELLNRDTEDKRFYGRN